MKWLHVTTEDKSELKGFTLHYINKVQYSFYSCMQTRCCRFFAIPVLSVMLVIPALAQDSFQTIKTFPADEAHQGVAVDSDFFYAIASRSIGKYDKNTGRRVDRWNGKPDGPIKHVDSGVVVNGKLYAAHSNYPEIPMTSSVEIWDTETLNHVGSHSFGIRWGSLTWVDRHDGSWWGVFAHYDEFEDQTGKDNGWTTLVQFNDRWDPMESWVVPKEVLNRFGTKSNSGGSWGPDGLLYVSGHDLPELYAMKLPKKGSQLELVRIVQVGNEGQGIAWDRTKTGFIYSVRRSTREVVVSGK